MIRLITKEYFYSKVGEKPEYIKFCIKPLKGNKATYTKEAIYFEIPEQGFFAFLPGFNIAVVPSQYNIKAKDINKESIDITDWEIKKIRDSVDYTLNTFRRVYIYDGKEEKEDGETGTYILENTRTGEKIDFSMYFYKSDYWNSLYFAVPEKLEYPVNVDKVRKKIMFIKNILLWK